MNAPTYALPRGSGAEPALSLPKGPSLRSFNYTQVNSGHVVGREERE